MLSQNKCYQNIYYTEPEQILPEQIMLSQNKYYQNKCYAEPEQMLPEQMLC